MVEMTVTEFVKKMRAVLDRIEHKGEEVIIVRDKRRIARIVPGSAHMTALEAIDDLFRTLPEDVGKEWLRDSRFPATVDGEIRDPWA